MLPVVPWLQRHHGASLEVRPLPRSLPLESILLCEMTRRDQSLGINQRDHTVKRTHQNGFRFTPIPPRDCELLVKGEDVRYDSQRLGHCHRSIHIIVILPIQLGACGSEERERARGRVRETHSIRGSKAHDSEMIRCLLH